MTRTISILRMARRRPRAKAHRQHRVCDTMYCTCGKQWDIKDEPPEGCVK